MMCNTVEEIAEGRVVAKFESTRPILSNRNRSDTMRNGALVSMVWLALLGGMAQTAIATTEPTKGAVAQSEVRALTSGERVRLQRMVRDMESAMQAIDAQGLGPFQHEAYVQRWRASIERYRNDLLRLPQGDDPDLQAAFTKLAELEALVAFGAREGASQAAELGDVQATLAAIERELRANRAPQWLPAPFDDDEALRWARIAASAKLGAQQAMEQLEHIGAVAHLPRNPGTVDTGAPYDIQDVDRLLRFAHATARAVDDALQETVANLGMQFSAQDRELEYFRRLDPENPSDRMNAFLQEGAQERIYGELDRQLAMTRSLAAWQRVFGAKPGDAIRARIEEIEALRGRYAVQRLQAVGDSRLPEPRSADTDRLAIARAILAEPSYGFGEHGPIVLTSPEIVQRERQVSRAEIKSIDVSLAGNVTLEGTETTWHYRWDEFKFATPIRDTESGDWYIWWITAKQFESGWEGTPLGRWVSGAATQGDLIPEKNFRE